MWGANMYWQLILDPRMVIDYMTKYVTKSDLSSNKACTSLMKTLFDRTVTEKGRSVQSENACPRPGNDPLCDNQVDFA